MVEVDRPALEIITRFLPSPRRQAHLQQNVRSLMKLESKDWVQTMLVDPYGRGLTAANARFATVEPFGKKVWLLDDDDYCVCPQLIERLDPAADVQVFKIHHCTSGVIPWPELWDSRQIKSGHVSTQSIIVSRDIWMEARHAWADHDHYESDFDYISRATSIAKNLVWTDVIIAKLDVIGHGAP